MPKKTALRSSVKDGVARGADGHPLGKGGVFRGIKGNRRRRGGGQVREGQDAAEPVSVGLVLDALEDGERLAVFRPRQALIVRLAGFELVQDGGLHVAELNAVADLALHIDCQRQPLALLVKGELGDVAQDEFLARGQFAQDQVAAARRGLGGSVDGEDVARLAGEGKAAEAFVFDLRAGRQVEQDHLGSARRRGRGRTHAAPAAPAARRGGEGQPAIVVREGQGAEAAAGNAMFLVAARLPHDGFALAPGVPQAVGEPLTVV